jgi:2-(1,2-epoxy-1,2-dihydrophenyl)acetyl-CoA isomerase
LAWGLATRVVEDGSAREETLDLLNQLAQRSVHSFGQSKRLFNISYGNSFESQIELERDGLSICSDHPDGQEGLKAFAQKRKPKFYAN